MSGTRAAAGDLAGDKTWRTRAFGLDIEADFPFPVPLATAPDPGTQDERPPRVELTAETIDEVRRRWPREARTRVFSSSAVEGPPALTLDRLEHGGYLLWGRGRGHYVVSGDGSRVLCAPGGVSAWAWGRLLVGQVLPLVAVLRELEVVHASAVCIEGRAVAIVGASGAGKTSLAARLVLAGGAFMADDVVALERGGEAVIAHGGTPLFGLRASTFAELTAAQAKRLGEVVSRGRREIMLRTATDPVTASVGELFFLDRRPENTELRFEPEDDPRLLLAGSYNTVHREPARLARMLDIVAALSSSAQVTRAVVPPGLGAPELAEAIAERARRSPNAGGAPTEPRLTAVA